MILGVDISSYLEVLSEKGQFFDGDTPIDPLEQMMGNGVYYLRTRVWKHPYSQEGAYYLGGTCDMKNFLELGELSKRHCMTMVMDLHYSDFWADPGKQFLPKDWKWYSFERLCVAVYEYTAHCLTLAKARGLQLPYIQIGNEITNGFLWPHGKLDDDRQGYDKLIFLLRFAIEACRQFSPDSKIILHLDQGGNKALYEEFFTKMEEAKVDYDVIGASYYPYWHGSMDELFENMENCRKFGKERMIMEVGYGFTDQPYSLEGIQPKMMVDERMANIPGFSDKYPLTPQGQADFIRDFLARCQEAQLDGVFYWEPLWLAGKRICWASEDGLHYIRELGKPTANEWANQCFFDYRGRKLPVFDAFSKKSLDFTK